MAYFTPADMGDDIEVVCSSCGVVFGLYWHRDGITELEFCPFCGDEKTEPPQEEE